MSREYNTLEKKKQELMNSQSKEETVRMTFMVPFHYLLVGGHHNLLASMTVAEASIKRSAIFTSCLFSYVHVSKHLLHM